MRNPTICLFTFILLSFFATTKGTFADHLFHSNHQQHSIAQHDNSLSKKQVHDLILTGFVLDNTCNTSLSDVRVQLTDLATKKVKCYLTKNDGAYYFILETNKEYLLTANMEVIEERRISTMGKHDEVLNSLLIVKNHKCGNTFRPLPFPPQPPKEDKCWKNPSSKISKLTYRIQIGIFKQQLSRQADFIRNAGFKIVEEQAPNGFYRYLTEDFYSLENTKKKLEILKEKGYNKAYIVSYFEGKRTTLSPEKAKERYEKRR